MRNYTICIYTPKAPAWAKARPSQAWLLAFGPAHDFLKPKLPKARPKLGLSGQAQAGTSLGETCKTIFIATFFTPTWTRLASEGCTAITNILADGLLVSTTFTIPFRFIHLKLEKIWRCFHIWDRSLLTISLPFFFLVAETGEISFERKRGPNYYKQVNSFSKGYTQVILYLTLRSN